MNRGLVYALVAFAVILFALFLWDRADLTGFVSLVRGFVSDHTEGVVVTILALIGARLVIRTPRQINRL